MRRSSRSRDLGGRTIAREHDLLPRPLQRVEESQHLALRLLAAREKLHVIEQQHVDHVEAPLEQLHRAVADRVIELLDELLERDVLHRELRLRLSARDGPMASIRCVLPSPELL